jgi:hypothetical protein
MSPFRSKAQAGYLHSHPEILGKEGLKEWDASSKGKQLPEHVKQYDQGGVVSPQKDTSMTGIFDQITKGGDKPKKEIKEMVHTKSHNGKHIVTHRHHSPAHHPDETHVMNDMAQLHSHMDAHAGTPNDGEAAPADGAAAPAPMTAAPSPAPAGPAGPAMGA